MGECTICRRGGGGKTVQSGEFTAPMVSPQPDKIIELPFTPNHAVIYGYARENFYYTYYFAVIDQTAYIRYTDYNDSFSKELEKKCTFRHNQLTIPSASLTGGIAYRYVAWRE